MFVDSGVGEFSHSDNSGRSGLCSLRSSAGDFRGDHGKLLKRMSLKSCALMSRADERCRVRFCSLLVDGTRAFFLFAREIVAVAAASFAHRNKLFFFFFENGKQYRVAVRGHWPQDVLLVPRESKLLKWTVSCFFFSWPLLLYITRCSFSYVLIFLFRCFLPSVVSCS